MALGFIKKIFTFGKDTATEPKPEAEAPVVEQQAAEPRAAEPHIIEPAPEEPAAASAPLSVDEERDALLEEAEAANPEADYHISEDVEPEIYPLPHAPSLPVTEDPVVPAEMETAGGPAGDEAVAEPEAEPVPVEEIVADEPAGSVEELVEEIAAAHVETVEAEAPGELADPVLEEAIRAERPLETPVLPKGFASSEKAVVEEAAPVAQPKRTWFQRLREGLARTSSQLTGQITSLFTKRKLDDDTLQDLEDLLIQADLGVETALRITDTLASERYGKDVTGADVSRIMSTEITKVLEPVAKPLELDLNHKPHVILVVGVNGTGKTTTIGKLAAKLSGAGLKVMLAAGDTFRAAAIEQLKIWAERTGSDIVSSKLGADAAGLAYEAYEQAKLKKSDVLIVDTAGRLQNKAELMAELEKIVRVLGKLDPDAPHTVLQTLDATTGQNAMNQVEIFRNVAGVSGLIMTKLDGTARGGILVAIAAKHKLPVYFIGVGEGIDDLEPFEAKDFAEAIAGVGA
ncbi:signal recognition particle-docking protein FtsY [Shinella zoogloeoides]|uniref:Signal recognition particle receptor FtsY n=1 Tax=Shinella zoogloeoides TaxID=352475 RepID=A0A6N8THA0_SHIZO|nr:signal recognition particle-docking protein FtsY [Shinella zoogloeoides]MXO01805.1 signal recognition particle-docking protein FtsY [Shinella zoogloeoides]UEX81109.1 signal recognition particle-docking protein FtsY [Shinella zoogloeoides]